MRCRNCGLKIYGFSGRVFCDRDCEETYYYKIEMEEEHLCEDGMTCLTPEWE